MRLLLYDIEFELLALECGAPPGGRSTTGRKAAGAQRPTPCEPEGRASKACRFVRYKPFGCAPPKALFYEVTFSQNFKVQTSKIEILVGVSVFVEGSKSLLPTLGRSANLSEPWAPRKDTSRSFVQFLQKYGKTQQFQTFTVFSL